MPNMLMLGQMGLSLVDGVAGFAQSRIQSDLHSAYQKYRNAISAINATQQQNTITLNSIAVRDASIAEAEDIEIASLRDRGTAEVAAAAAGVKGNSVDLAMRELAGDAARANKNRLDNLNSQFAAFAQERKNVNVARVMNQDISIIPKASVSTALLGVGARMLNVLDSHQPQDVSIAGQLSRLRS